MLAHLEHAPQAGFKPVCMFDTGAEGIKPGITGWAQVNGYRGATTKVEKMETRVQFDLFYIHNWSFWFDMKIVFITVFKGFVNRNAF